jgi:hypothetical protein
LKRTSPPLVIWPTWVLATAEPQSRPRAAIDRRSAATAARVRTSETCKAPRARGPTAAARARRSRKTRARDRARRQARTPQAGRRGACRRSVADCESVDRTARTDTRSLNHSPPLPIGGIWLGRTDRGGGCLRRQGRTGVAVRPSPTWSAKPAQQRWYARRRAWKAQSARKESGCRDVWSLEGAQPPRWKELRCRRRPAAPTDRRSCGAAPSHP